MHGGIGAQIRRERESQTALPVLLPIQLEGVLMRVAAEAALTRDGLQG